MNRILISIGSALVGGLVVYALQPAPAPTVTPDGVDAPLEDSSQTKRAEKPNVASAESSQPGTKLGMEATVKPSAPGFQVAPIVKSPRRLQREAMAAQFPPDAWTLKNGSETEKAQVRRKVAHQQKLERIMDAEPVSEKATSELIDALEEITADSKAHVLAGECRQTVCKVELIHENDLDGLDLHPDGIARAKDWPSDVFVERSEEDGKIRHTVYYKDPKYVTQRERNAAAEMQRQLEIMAQSSDE